MKISKKESRRGFLSKGIKSGIGITAGIGALALGSKVNTDENEAVKMIASDGTVYEIDKQHLFKMCNGKVSNSRLRMWLDEEQKNVSK